MIKDEGLWLDWCEHKAAAYAAERWHYSECLPASPTAKIGVWEDGDFIGAVTYSKGSNGNMASMFSLDATEVCELTRVALNDHDAPVSQVLSISRDLLIERFPKIKIVVSYADPFQDHSGSIYQADNWHYIGKTEKSRRIIIDGESKHARSMYEKYGTSSANKLRQRLPAKDIGVEHREGKHRYAYPLTEAAKRKLEPMSEPYP